MSNEPPPNPLTNTYQPSAWEEEDTSITKENIALYAVTFPISQNSPITISNTLSVGGLLQGPLPHKPQTIILLNLLPPVTPIIRHHKVLLHF
jgi:hypothetical protein